jgi:hypothetical protein
MEARLASLEERFIPNPNATMDAVLQRAMVRLTCQDLRHLMEAADLRDEGCEGELTAEHHAASRRLDDFVAEERDLASGKR